MNELEIRTYVTNLSEYSISNNLTKRQQEAINKELQKWKFYLLVFDPQKTLIIPSRMNKSKLLIDPKLEQGRLKAEVKGKLKALPSANDSLLEYLKTKNVEQYK